MALSIEAEISGPRHVYSLQSYSGETISDQAHDSLLRQWWRVYSSATVSLYPRHLPLNIPSSHTWAQRHCWAETPPHCRNWPHVASSSWNAHNLLDICVLYSGLSHQPPTQLSPWKYLTIPEVFQTDPKLSEASCVWLRVLSMAAALCLSQAGTKVATLCVSWILTHSECIPMSEQEYWSHLHFAPRSVCWRSVSLLHQARVKTAQWRAWASN